MDSENIDVFGEELEEPQVSALETDFNRAAAAVQSLASNASSSDLLYLYARYKQAIEGTCNTSRPGFFDMKGKQKWDAWNALGDMSKEDAMREYIERVRQLDPDFEESSTKDGNKPEDSGKSSAAFGVSVSTMQREEPDVAEGEKNIFDWVREDQADKVGAFLRSNPDAVNKPDLQGLTPLHWACDRGSVNIVRILLSDYGAKVDVRDGSLQTPLHYASSCGHREIVRLLLENGAEKSIEDENGETCMDVALDEATRNLFREMD